MLLLFLEPGDGLLRFILPQIVGETAIDRRTSGRRQWAKRWQHGIGMSSAGGVPPLQEALSAVALLGRQVSWRRGLLRVVGVFLAGLEGRAARCEWHLACCRRRACTLPLGGIGELNLGERLFRICETLLIR